MDITLNIDASGDVKSNHYRTAFGSPLFKICYLQLAGIIGDEIDAKDNFWEGDIDYKIFNSGQPGFVHCNHHTSNVTLIVDPQASGHSCNNGPTDDPQDPTPHPDIADSNFTGDDPNCLDNLQQVLYDTYWDGYDAYLWETHTDANDRSVSDAYYYDVATVPTSTALTYPLKCQQLIQIAQSRISTPPPPINLDNDGNGQWQVAEAEGFYTKIFPNPAKGNLPSICYRVTGPSRSLMFSER